MNGLREALYGQFLTRKLIFTIIPIARECSIKPYGFVASVYNFSWSSYYSSFVKDRIFTFGFLSIFSSFVLGLHFFFFSWTLLDQPTKKVQESQCHVTFKFPRGALLRLCTCDRSFHLFLNVLTNYWFALHSRSFSPTAKPLCLTSLHKRQRNRKDRVN